MAKSKCNVSVIWSEYTHSTKAIVLGAGGKILKTVSYGPQITYKQQQAEARKLKRKFCRR